MYLDKKVEARILEHAAQNPQQEICGLVIRKGEAVEYFPCRNAADKPSEFFAVDPDDWIAAEEGGADVAAVVHSHVNGRPFLSTHDRISQLQTGLPWVLACNGSVRMFGCRPKLLGRAFVYGQSDCCTLCSDALHLCGVNIPPERRLGLDEDIERGAIVNYLNRFGFRQVAPSDMQPGDAVLFSIGGEASHLGIYVGQDCLLHHLTGRPSRKEHFGTYLKSRLHSIWRHPEFEPANIAAVWNDFEV